MRGFGLRPEPPAAASDAGVDAIAAEARAALRSGIGTAVVGRHDLDVFHLPLTVRALVFDANVRKVDVAVDDRKVATAPPTPPRRGVAASASARRAGARDSGRCRKR